MTRAHRFWSSLSIFLPAFCYPIPFTPLSAAQEGGREGVGPLPLPF